MRSILFASAFAMVTMGAMAQGKLDCAKSYLNAIEKFMGTLHKLTPERLAGLNYMALRAYDACQAGDDQDARALFNRLAEMKL